MAAFLFFLSLSHDESSVGACRVLETRWVAAERLPLPCHVARRGRGREDYRNSLQATTSCSIRKAGTTEKLELDFSYFSLHDVSSAQGERMCQTVSPVPPAKAKLAVYFRSYLYSFGRLLASAFGGGSGSFIFLGNPRRPSCALRPHQRVF